MPSKKLHNKVRSIEASSSIPIVISGSTRPLMLQITNIIMLHHSTHTLTIPLVLPNLFSSRPTKRRRPILLRKSSVSRRPLINPLWYRRCDTIVAGIVTTKVWNRLVLVTVEFDYWNRTTGGVARW
jgi:hypothetical protein